MRPLLMYAPVLLATFFGFHSARSQAMDSLDLTALVAEAVRNNPQLQAARDRASGVRMRVDQATSWESPQAGVEFYQTPIRSFPNPLKDWMENDYFLQQMIPFPGKLSAMGDAAENQAKMSDEEYNALQQKVIRDLKSAYYELYLAQQKIRINADNQNLMRNFVEIARKQYEVGMGKQADVLRAQTELSTLMTDAVNLQQEKTVAESMINSLLSRPANAPLGQTGEIEHDIPVWTFAQVQPLALDSRPELKAMNYNIEMNKAEVAAAKREYFPDLMAKLTYKDMANTKNDFWAAMVGITIPIVPWSSGKYSGKVEENELNVKSAEGEYANMKNMVLFELQQALVSVQTNRNLVLLYRGTSIPQAEQTLQSTVASYQTGKTEFLMVIDANRMLNMQKLDYALAVMNYMTSQARLEQAVGLSINEIAARIH